jgi:hypothetical protein
VVDTITHVDASAGGAVDQFERGRRFAGKLELDLELRHGGIAAFAGKQVAQILSNLGVGIHRRPRFKVGVTPSAQDEAIGTQFSHAAQPT